MYAIVRVNRSSPAAPLYGGQLGAYKGDPVTYNGLIASLSSRAYTVAMIVALIKSNGVDFAMNSSREFEIRGLLLDADANKVISAIKANVRPGVVVATGSAVPAAGGSRAVIAKVTGTVNFVANLGTSAAADNIKAALVNNGWAINSVTADTSLWYPGGSQTFMVSANVLNAYSDQDVVSNLMSQLSGLLSGISVNLVSTNPTYQAGGTPGTGGAPGLFGTAGLFDNFGLDLTKYGLGALSGAAVVGVIALIFILRK